MFASNVSHLFSSSDFVSGPPASVQLLLVVTNLCPHPKRSFHLTDLQRFDSPLTAVNLPSNHAIEVAITEVPLSSKTNVTKSIEVYEARP